MNALRKSPNDTDILTNLAVCLKYQQRHTEALRFLEKSSKIKPSDADIYLNLGVIHRDLLNLKDALFFYKKALDISPKHPEAMYNLGLLYLLNGDFEEGWRYYMWRWKTYGFRNIQRPRRFWDGKKGNHRVLLIAEQGYGDTIQAIRYAEVLSKMGLRVSLYCQNALKPLFEEQLGLESVFDINPNEEIFDYSIHLLDIPYVLKTNLSTIPSHSFYLTPKKACQELFEDIKADKRLKVGIAWLGSKTNIRGRYRSCRAKDILPLLNSEGVAFYSLQKDYDYDEYVSIPDKLRPFDMSDRLQDFSHTAGLIANLDIVITVDTAVAHLAGAMGKPVWLMLHYSSDWRWLLDRTDSPWYPSMTIFRQDTFGRWDGIVEDIKDKLAKIPKNKKN